MSNTVSVQFKGAGSVYSGSYYSYLTDLPLKPGDEVIVDSPSCGFVAVKVHAILGELNDGKATKWIVQKIDPTQYKARQEAERRKAVLVAKLKAIEKSVEETSRYHYLAAVSPEAAKLIEELKNL